jgi:uncharacterized damage-inducible protein DinB
MLLVHCQSFSSEYLNREFEGFGYPSIKLQLHHAIAGQKYWIGVLQGRMDVDEDPDAHFTMDDMMVYRESVRHSMERYLSAASTEELISARPMTTWGNIEKVLIPAHVVIRTLTHMYHHQGQVAAMCRLLGKPIEPGMDYPHLA